MARLGALLLAGLLLSPQAGAEERQVSQKQKQFQPSELTVTVGDEVVFLNDDEISHNVFSRSEGSKFNLKIQRPGEHKRHRFERPGEVVIRCAIHPKMKMTVQVKPEEEENESSPVPDESEPAPAAPEAP